MLKLIKLKLLFLLVSFLTLLFLFFENKNVSSLTTLKCYDGVNNHSKLALCCLRLVVELEERSRMGSKTNIKEILIFKPYNELLTICFKGILKAKKI